MHRIFKKIFSGLCFVILLTSLTILLVIRQKLTDLKIKKAFSGQVT